ncbi:P-loop containing nucleoside triphosphate hydrolase protein [Lactarius vividus]|nr:P-loop containing nucleoside triphosphate hydrolase protein [Lactarius vividus]
MSTHTCDTVLGLSDHLQFLRTCPGDDLKWLILNIGLHERLLMSFLDALEEHDRLTCYRAALVCYSVTNSTQVPREMQFKVVLANRNGEDCLVSAGTGSGKTLPIALNVLLDDPDAHLVTLTISPLKRLQVTQETDFNSQYGIPTVVINEDTPRDDAWWSENIWNSKNGSLGRARLLIVTVEQLFKSREGHFPRLAVLVRNLWFQRHIARVIVDEAHNIHTAGLSHYGLDAFRPAWGRLDELKAILPHPIHVTSNRPNTVYAAHEVLNSIEDFQNYECFLACPFSLVSQPRVLIFVDKKELALRHYHSQMSQKYLQVAHEAFTTPEGNCRIMVATSGQSVGVDFPDIKIVCTAGLPASMVDVLQRGGRALRNSSKDALFVIFYEPWVHEVSLEEYNEGDSCDPDRPRGQLRSSSQRRERAPFSCLKLVKSTTCLRAEFASYLDDKSSSALAHTTMYCCNAMDCDGSRFGLQEFLPGKLAITPPSLSTEQKPKRGPHNIYRPKKERWPLECCLIEWLKREHSADPARSVRPPDFILSSSQRETLVRANPKTVKTAQDITALLGESAEWSAEWSAKVFEVIAHFENEKACITEQSTTQRKRKRK